jgi:hypothetical protein
MVGERDLEAGGKRSFVSFFVLSVGGTSCAGFFQLAAEREAIFTFDRTWSTIGLLNESEVDCLLVEGN